MDACRENCYIGMPWWSVVLLVTSLALLMAVMVWTWFTHEREHGPVEMSPELEQRDAFIESQQGELNEAEDLLEQWMVYRTSVPSILVDQTDEWLDGIPVSKSQDEKVHAEHKSWWQRARARLRGQDEIEEADSTPLPEPDVPVKEWVDSGSGFGWIPKPRSTWRNPLNPEPGSVQPEAVREGQAVDPAQANPQVETFPQESPPHWYLGGKKGNTLHYWDCPVLLREAVHRWPVPREFQDLNVIRSWASRQKLRACDRCWPLADTPGATDKVHKGVPCDVCFPHPNPEIAEPHEEEATHAQDH